MTEIINPILRHRQEVSEKIIKGFETDELEKSQYWQHKYIDKVPTKSGKKRYLYADTKGIRRVWGKRVNLGKGKEMTQVNGTLYDSMKKNDLKRKILTLDGMTNFKEVLSGKETTYYKFKKDGIGFKIRIAAHTRSSEDKEVLPPIFYHDRDRAWFIDANLGNYNPRNVMLAVNSIATKLSEYNNDEMIGKLKDYANENKIKPNLSDDEFDTYNKADKLAAEYIKDNELEEDKFGTTLQVLKYVSVSALNEIIEETEDEQVKKALFGEI